MSQLREKTDSVEYTAILKIEKTVYSFCAVKNWKRMKKSSDVITRVTLIYQKKLRKITHAIPLHPFPSSKFALCNAMSSSLSGTG